MATKLEIFCNGGNLLKRAVNYIKASWDNYSVTIKNLTTQSTFQYDMYHNLLEEGKYVLLFVDQEGKQDYHTFEVEITPNSPDTIYITYSYSKFLMFLSVKEATPQEINELASQKKLTYPLGYRG